MVSDTSKEAYKHIIDTLGERQAEVLNAFKIYGDHTNLEISHISNIPINVVTARVGELREQSILSYKGKRVSQIDGVIIGRVGNIWGLKDKPTPPKPEPKKEIPKVEIDISKYPIPQILL